MSLNVGRLVYYLDADDTGLNSGLDRSESRLSRFGGAIGTMMARVGVAAGGVLVAAGAIGLSTAARMEQAEIAFTTMLGSGEAAQAFLQRLKTFAAQTPFEFPELQTAASSLISVGISADKVIPIMTTLGDVTSGMGTGSEGIKRATVALQQMNAAGRITAEDLNQLRDAGIPVYDLLAAATGKTKEEVVELSRTGKLGRQELEQLMAALESGAGLERFTGLMAQQSQSLTGLWSTLKDTFSVGMADAIQPLIPLIKDGLAGAIAFLNEKMPVLQAGLAGVVAAISTGDTGQLGGDLQKLADSAVAAWPAVREAAASLAELGGDTVSVAAVMFSFLADNLDKLVPLLPVIVALFLAYKVSQIALNFAALASIPITIAQIVAQTRLTAALNTLTGAMGVQRASLIATTIAHAKNAAAMISFYARAYFFAARILVQQAAAAVASAARTSAAYVAAHAVMIAGWIRAAVVSMASAVRMAAAWFIALGPIGWAIAAVILVVALVIANWDRVKEYTLIAWSAVSAAVVAAWEWIKGAVSAAAGFVVAVVMGYIGLLQAFWGGAWSAVTAVAGVAWDAIRGIAQAGAAFVVAIVTGYVNVLQAVWSAAWNVVRAVAGAAWAAIQAVVNAGIQAVLAYVRGVSAVIGFVRDAFNSARDAASGGIGGLVALAAGIPGRVLSAIGNLGSLLFDAGGDLIRGLARGITSAVGAAISAVVNALGSIVSAAKAKAGISSPSALFAAEVGLPIAQGIAAGIAGNAGLTEAAIRAAITVPNVGAINVPRVNLPARAVRGGDGATSSAPGTVVEKHLHYHAAVGRSLPEDDFYDAAGRSRMLTTGW